MIFCGFIAVTNMALNILLVIFYLQVLYKANKVKKPDKFFICKPSQNYGVPLKYGAHNFLLAAQHYRAHFALPQLVKAGT